MGVSHAVPECLDIRSLGGGPPIYDTVSPVFFFSFKYLRNPLPSFFWVIKIKPGFPKKTYVFSKWYFNHCNQEPSRKEG